jgi:hypothetical protein
VACREVIDVHQRKAIGAGGSPMTAEQAIAFTQSESAHRRQWKPADDKARAPAGYRSGVELRVHLVDLHQEPVGGGQLKLAAESFVGRRAGDGDACGPQSIFQLVKGFGCFELSSTVPSFCSGLGG